MPPKKVSCNRQIKIYTINTLSLGYYNDPRNIQDKQNFYLFSLPKMKLQKKNYRTTAEFGAPCAPTCCPSAEPCLHHQSITQLQKCLKISNMLGLLSTALPPNASTKLPRAPSCPLLASSQHAENGKQGCLNTFTSKPACSGTFLIA